MLWWHWHQTVPLSLVLWKVRFAGADIPRIWRFNRLLYFHKCIVVTSVLLFWLQKLEAVAACYQKKKHTSRTVIQGIDELLDLTNRRLSSVPPTWNSVDFASKYFSPHPCKNVQFGVFLAFKILFLLFARHKSQLIWNSIPPTFFLQSSTVA